MVKTLFEAMALVTLVVFLFLQSWRTTLIPVLAVPVAIIGTFFGLSFLGFPINLLTLFALVLAIGIVVDDAIVVIENVERIMEEEKVPARGGRRPGHGAGERRAGRDRAGRSARCSSRSAFLGGITGTMLKQFAITLVIAVVISGIVALTLTPALCAMLLKDTPHATHEPVLPPVQRLVRPHHGRYVGGVGRVLAPAADLPGRVRGAAGARVRALAPGARARSSRPRTRASSWWRSSCPTAPLGSGPTRWSEQIEGILRKEKSIRTFTALVGLQPAGAGEPVERRRPSSCCCKPWDERTKKATSSTPSSAG